MANNTTYDRQLRSIGQSLEAQRIQVFELTRQGENYTARGDPEKETSLLAALRNWQKRLRSEGMTTSLAFTQHDIDEIDHQGSGNRSKANRIPDFHSLANTLRTVGAYLDEKNAELIELHKKQLSVTILSRNTTGYPEMEERSLGSFYELFVKLHALRNRAVQNSIT
ncbi:MAG: hypothetical protein ACXW5W_17030 [Candidatus Binatia bacterium]